MMTDNEITIDEPVDKEKVKAQILDVRGCKGDTQSNRRRLRRNGIHSYRLF